MSEPYGSSDAEYAPEQRRTNRGKVIAAGAGLAVLAAIGGTAGYILAGQSGGHDVADPGTSSSASASPSVSPAPRKTTSSKPSSPPTLGSTGLPSGEFRLPDVTNQEFKQARQHLRDQRLGVTVIFGSPGDGNRVERTDPEQGTIVRAGTTIKLFVSGRAPITAVPDVVGQQCNPAGSVMADHGLEPQYPNGRSGQVVRQDPDPKAAANNVRWGDKVQLFCGLGTAIPTQGSGG